MAASISVSTSLSENNLSNDYLTFIIISLSEFKVKILLDCSSCVTSVSVSASNIILQVGISSGSHEVSVSFSIVAQSFKLIDRGNYNASERSRILSAASRKKWPLCARANLWWQG